MTVLCYHGVQPDWAAPMSMEPQRFEEHARWLAARRSVVPLHAALDRHGIAGLTSGRRLVLTFDDGFKSLHSHALPVLRRHRLPATVFLVAKTLADADAGVDWVDHPPSEPLTMLDAAQIHEMQSAGITFESHSYAHRTLTELTFDECLRDLKDSRELLETVLGHRVRLLAYPRGRHDAQVRAAAAKAGYTHAFSLPEHQERPEAYAIPRVGVYHQNSTRHLRIKATGPYLRVRTSPVLSQVRRHLAGPVRAR
jgi:peptidoglycan/xylan/chitin deacetylase (PgdA/CDA1 family)